MKVDRNISLLSVHADLIWNFNKLSSKPFWCDVWCDVWSAGSVTGTVTTWK